MKLKSLSPLVAVLVLVSSVACAADVSYVNGRAPGDAGPPFSGAVMVDDTLYVSGMLGLVDGKVPDDPAEEARLVMDGIKGAIEDAGMTMNDIVVVQIFCSDVSHYGAFNEVYASYFSSTYPARAFIGSGKLLFDARFEVMVTAVKR